MYGGEKRLRGKDGRTRRNSNLYVLLQNGVSNISMKDQAYKILLDLYNKERSKSPASEFSQPSIMAKPQINRIVNICEFSGKYILGSMRAKMSAKKPQAH